MGGASCPREGAPVQRARYGSRVLGSPIAPMLAKLSDGLPEGEGWIYEPKWDGFRALVFRDRGELLIQSRDLKPLNRYFPELEPPSCSSFPSAACSTARSSSPGPGGLDFDALLLRIHPAASRIKLLAAQTPASYVAFDLLALGEEDLREAPQAERRARLEGALAAAAPPLYLTPATRDRAVAQDWFSRFEGAGLDGVVAKRAEQTYQPDKRVMLKVKHQRTADCVVAGFRWHKNGPGTMVGSLLLGLHDEEGTLHHVGVTSSFTAARRQGAGAGAIAAAGGGGRGASLAGVGAVDRRAADARSGVEVESREGPVVGAAADRAGVRGGVRPSAGGPVPPRDDVLAVEGG